MQNKVVDFGKFAESFSATNATRAINAHARPKFLIKVGLNASGKSTSSDTFKNVNFVDMSIDNVVSKMLLYTKSASHVKEVYNQIRFTNRYSVTNIPIDLLIYIHAVVTDFNSKQIEKKDRITIAPVTNSQSTTFTHNDLHMNVLNDLLIQYFMRKQHHISWEVTGFNAAANIATVNLHLDHAKDAQVYYDIYTFYPFVLYTTNLFRALRRTDQPVHNFANTMSQYTKILTNVTTEFANFMKDRQGTLIIRNNTCDKNSPAYSGICDTTSEFKNNNLSTAAIQGSIAAIITTAHLGNLVSHDEKMLQPNDVKMLQPKDTNLESLHIYNKYIHACGKLQEKLQNLAKQTQKHDFYKNSNSNVNVVKDIIINAFKNNDQHQNQANGTDGRTQNGGKLQSKKKKTSETYEYQKRKYVIYQGPRGGKYIQYKKEWVNIRKLA